ncbi:MAG: hypothetical protein K9M51_00370 [Candidatus Gracilibacteria bacterium]|nr:hypothetical protein [Candidatus Gracilibacteria bacterium]
MQKNLELLECIATYNFSIKKDEKKLANKALKKILEIIKTKNINYSEFVSFWPVVDISYSLFKKMTEEDKIKIIEKIVKKYLEMRHTLYLSYGYSPTTLQVGKDAKAHKESGNLGGKKVAKILDTFGYKNANTEPLETFISKGRKKYIEADKKGKKLFKQLLEKEKIAFAWSEQKENKFPDFLIRHKDLIFIVEHKHMKEAGGGQDKQMSEIISFIRSKEKNSMVYYLSFLDGIYFNLFTQKKYLKKGKILNQFSAIKKALKDNPKNYFVNTAGFKMLLENLNK